MAWLFKLSGLIIRFLSSAGFGFYNSYKLKMREKKLRGIICSMTELRERVRTGAGEIGEIIEKSFGKTAPLFGDGARLDCEWLTKGDAEVLKKFFTDIGMSDAEAECERTELYITLMQKQCNDAEKKCGELCRLYGTLGVLGGLFICVFFL